MNDYRLYVLILVLLAPSLTAAEPNPWLRRLPFEQAVITYQISGMETGQEILYIRDYGERTARYRETSATILGIAQKSSTVEITTPEWIYLFDLREGTGTKSVNPVQLMIDEYDKLTPAEKEKVAGRAEKMAGILSIGLPGTVEEHAREILGLSCDRLKALGSTIYAIHGTGITLLSEIDVMGITVKSAAIAIEKSRYQDVTVTNADTGAYVGSDDDNDSEWRVRKYYSSSSQVPCRVRAVQDLDLADHHGV